MTEAVLSALAGGATVVTANNRLARSVALAYDRCQASAGLAAWPTPPVVPWHAWLERLWWQSFERGGAAGRRRLLTDVQARALWREVTRPHAPAGGSAAGLAARTWQLCQDWQISVAMLGAEADSADADLFAGLARDYQARCQAGGWIDGGALVALLVDDLRSGALTPPPAVCLAGFDTMVPRARALFDALAAAGTRVEQLPAPRVPHTRSIRVACQDGQRELEIAARWARWHRECEPQGAIAVVVPDLESRVTDVRREFLDVFVPGWRLVPAGELPVNFSCGTSLAQTELVRAAILTLRGLAGRMNFRDAGALLRTPYLPGWEHEQALRGRIEIKVRRQVGPQTELDTLCAMARPGAPRFAESMESLHQAAGALPGRQGASAWALFFRATLAAVGWPGDRPLATDEYQAAQAFDELIADLESCAGVTGRLGFPAALALLQALADERAFQPAGNAGAVQVLGILEAMGQQFDHLWVCGLTSATWPPGGRPSALLPLSLQRRLGLPDSSPGATRERAERQLRWLLSSAGDVVASWARQRDAEPQTPSPLIAALDEVAGECVAEQWRGATLRMAQFATAATEDLVDDPAPKIAKPRPFRGGVALLERQARCPARAFLEFRLGAQEIPTPQAGIDAGRRGALLHGALEDIFRQVDSSQRLRELLPARTGQLVDDAIARQLRKSLPPGNAVLQAIARIEQRRMRQLLLDFLATERARDDFRILAVEDHVLTAHLPPAIAALDLVLRPDRVDVMADGGRLVIDYKTGTRLPAAREIHGPRPRSPQLPLYATAVDAHGVAFIHLRPSGPRWLGVGQASWGIDGMLEPQRFTHDEVSDWGAQRAAWWTALERLATEFLEGSFLVDRWRLDEARGQWAMAIRFEDAGDDDEEQDE